jgi:putative restriction endonuclease
VDTDFEIRLAAFKWLEHQSLLNEEILSHNSLVNHFHFKGESIILLGAKGIWKPKIMNLPISITTIDSGPYNDSFTKDGLLQYKYRGTNPNHPDNVGLRELMRNRIPIIYFYRLEKGQYMAAWPCYILQDDIQSLTFTVAVDSMATLNSKKEQKLQTIEEDQATYARRYYLTSNTKIRLHQRSFRERVLRAYDNQCSLCQLKHTELLDAAHIIPDNEELGLPIIQNGLSLCKIHHAAFDNNIIGINPDYHVKVRMDILNEIDGPMLKHGIQSLENQKMILPANTKNWPDKEKLDFRYNLFLKAV